MNEPEPGQDARNPTTPINRRLQRSRAHKAFQGKVQVGKTYLDTWGQPHTIHGHTVLRRGWGAHQPDTLDHTKVYSGGWHFDVKTGTAAYGPQLVQLPPAKELAYWIDNLAQIRAVNCKDKLEIPSVKEGMANMEARIAELMEGVPVAERKPVRCKCGARHAFGTLWCDQCGRDVDETQV